MEKGRSSSSSVDDSLYDLDDDQLYNKIQEIVYVFVT